MFYLIGIGNGESAIRHEVRTFFFWVRTWAIVEVRTFVFRVRTWAIVEAQRMFLWALTIRTRIIRIRTLVLRDRTLVVIVENWTRIVRVRTLVVWIWVREFAVRSRDVGIRTRVFRVGTEKVPALAPLQYQEEM